MGAFGAALGSSAKALDGAEACSPGLKHGECVSAGQWSCSDVLLRLMMEVGG